jgi:hypothetical protein
MLYQECKHHRSNPHSIRGSRFQRIRPICSYLLVGSTSIYTLRTLPFHQSSIRIQVKVIPRRNPIDTIIDKITSTTSFMLFIPSMMGMVVTYEIQCREE